MTDRQTKARLWMTAAIVLFFVYLILVAPTMAYAGGDKKHDGDVNITNRTYKDNTWDNSTNQDQAQDQAQGQDQMQGQGQDQAQNQSAEASNGDQISMNTSQFYALSLMFPQAVDCFTGVQGGGQVADMGDATSGFLGLHFLNKSCWLQKQASAEQDIELNARLRCGDKHYRNAIAYDAPWGERRERCIEIKVASALAQMEQFKSEMKRLQECHDRIDDANERTERCQMSFIEAQTK